MEKCSFWAVCEKKFLRSQAPRINPHFRAIVGRRVPEMSSCCLQGVHGTSRRTPVCTFRVNKAWTGVGSAGPEAMRRVRATGRAASHV